MQRDLLDNYLFDLKPKANIYRYTTVDRLFQMFNEKKLILVLPSKWDDPFENLLSKVIYNDGDNQISLRGITEKFVGQCWTKSQECDGLWRNYTNMKNTPNIGVKITTQAHKLLHYVANCENDKLCNINTFIGNVQYEKDKKIINFFKKIDINWVTDTKGKNPAKTLLIKRNEFKYENEVRIIKSINDIENSSFIKIESISDGKYYIDIDPNDMITSIVFSPMMDDKNYHKNKQRLIELGFNHSKISKSKLYDLFNESIVIS